MNATEVLAREKVETKKRVAVLKEETGLELLQKEAIECEHELCRLKRPSIFGWIKQLLKKGGKENGHKRTQDTHS